MRADRDGVSRIFALSDLTTTIEVGSCDVATVLESCGGLGAADELSS